MKYKITIVAILDTKTMLDPNEGERFIRRLQEADLDRHDLIDFLAKEELFISCEKRFEG